MEMPPLNALKAFEATVRNGSFTAAAQELNVSSSAVSMQVRKLEIFLGKKVFFRRNNTLILTSAGRTLHLVAHQSLSDIARVTEDLLGLRTRPHVMISTVQSLAERYLAPAVAAIRPEFPRLGISIQIEDDPVDLQRRSIDLRLTVGGHVYAATRTEQLFRESVVPICCPRMAEEVASIGGLQSMKDEHFIHIHWGEAYAPYPAWNAWFQSVGIARLVERRNGIGVSAAGTGIALAQRGMGVVLAPKRFATDQIRAGTLVVVSETPVYLSATYYAIMPTEIASDNVASAKADFVRKLVAVVKSAAIADS